MKLSVWSSYFHDLSLEEMVQAFSTSGYHYAEISTEHGDELLKRENSYKEALRLRQFADEHGLRFLQGHLKLEVNICGEKAREDMDELKKWLDHFMELGVRAAVLHSGIYRGKDTISSDKLLETRVKSIGELTQYIKGTDMTICLENLRTTTIDCESLLEIIETVDSPNLGICLDTGHLNIFGGDQETFIRNAGSYLKALHITDNNGQSDQHLMPYGCGTVDWDKVIKALKENSYKGLFNFEIPGETRAPMEIRLAKLEYIKKIYKYFDQP